MAKGIVFIADGMAGRPIPELGGKTTLESANTPSMDRIAAEGECGLLDPISPGVRAGSDTSHLALLGYNPHEYYTGRGPFEAMGAGLAVKPGDIALRMNFATIDDKGIVTDRRAGRIQESEGTHQLAELLNNLEIDGVQILCNASTAHRGAVVLRGKGLSCEIEDADPHREGKPIPKAKPLTKDAERTALVVDKLVAKAIELFRDNEVNKKRIKEGKPPANCILLRGAGVAPQVQPFRERYKIKGAAVVEVGLIRGIARFLGLDLIDVPTATGGMDTDEVGLARAVVAALKTHDLVLTNIKAADLGGHDGDYQEKILAIEKADRMAGIIYEGIKGSDTHLAILADHATPVVFRDHSGDTVPIATWGKMTRPDGVKSYGERPCIGGGLGRIRGIDLMPIMLNLMGVAEKYGA
jgi:2,3-bisphosphoglycerate-independent phosphoglycerate mutase